MSDAPLPPHLQDPALWDAKAARDYDGDESDPRFSRAHLDAVCDYLAPLAGGRPALEFAAGTGRILLPLRARGLSVDALDFAQPMLDELQLRAAPAPVHAVCGDMTHTRVGEAGRYGLVYLVFNGIMNVLTEEAQAATFANAAWHLAPGGCFVIETMIPTDIPGPTEPPLRVFAQQPGYIGLDHYDVARQLLVSHHFQFSTDPDDEAASLRRTTHRYASAADYVAMAEAAGLRCTARHADWQGKPFAEGGDMLIAQFCKA